MICLQKLQDRRKRCDRAGVDFFCLGNRCRRVGAIYRAQRGSRAFPLHGLREMQRERHMHPHRGAGWPPEEGNTLLTAQARYSAPASCMRKPRLEKHQVARMPRTALSR